MFPLDFPVLSLMWLLQFLFGLLWNGIVGWAHDHKLWHVSVSVIGGVAATVIIPGLFLWNEDFIFWQAALFYLVCFVCSGLPMIYGSTRRTVKESHQRRPLPNNAMRVRDEVVMDIHIAVEKIVAKDMEQAVLVHVMHKWIGALKSL